jgi:hypothetical protein
VDLGDTLGFRADLYDHPAEQGGVPVNATTVTLTITLPDGTTTSPSVSNPPTVTGKYALDYVTSLSGPSGRYVGTWLFTMATGKTTSYVETFDVGGALITVDEAQAHLRSAGIITTAADLDQLQWLCMVASQAVEQDLGLVIVRRVCIDTFDGGGYELNLQTPPRPRDGGAITITSVVESGTTLTASDYVLRKARWRLCRGSTTYLTPWARGVENITVTYTAGCLNPPLPVRYAALGEVQGAWQSSQQAAHPLLDEFNAEEAISRAAPRIAGAMWGAYNALRSVNNA